MAQLSDTSLRKALADFARSDAQRRELGDGTGLRVRFGPRGAQFIYAATAARPRRTITLGRYPDLSLAQARVLVAEAKAAQSEGRLDVLIGRLEAQRGRRSVRRVLLLPGPEGPTLGAVMDDFLVQLRATGIASHRAVGRSLDTLRLALGERPISRIARGDVVAVITAKAADTPVAGRRLLSFTRRMFRWAVATERLQRDPLATLAPRDLLLPPPPLHVDKVLSPAEVREFWQRTGSSEGATATLRFALRALLLTAVRPAELLKARLEHVDLGARTWVVPVSSQKTARTARRAPTDWQVPLSVMAVKVFRDLAGLAASVGSPWLVASPRPGEKGAVHRNSLNTALDKMGLPFTVYALRKTARTFMTDLQVDFATAERCLHHDLGTVAMAYDRSDAFDARKDALERLGMYIRDLGAGEPPAATLARWRINASPLAAEEPPESA
jgi:integrase